MEHHQLNDKYRLTLIPYSERVEVNSVCITHATVNEDGEEGFLQIYFYVDENKDGVWERIPYEGFSFNVYHELLPLIRASVNKFQEQMNEPTTPRAANLGINYTGFDVHVPVFSHRELLGQ